MLKVSLLQSKRLFKTLTDSLELTLQTCIMAHVVHSFDNVSARTRKTRRFLIPSRIAFRQIIGLLHEMVKLLPEGSYGLVFSGHSKNFL